ncbi:uncharacterized protein METZ01_LOCUS382746, partial [marine metagenome]
VQKWWYKRYFSKLLQINLPFSVSDVYSPEFARISYSEAAKMAEECGFISCKDRKTGCIVINNSRFLWGLCRKLHKHIVILNLEVDLANSALLVLEDGSVFKGTAIGATGSAVGEVVFNTSMTGYQEILTDPSYAEQLITLTYPHIGNTGTNEEDVEADKIWSKGLIIRDLPLVASNFRQQQTLSEYLKAKGVVGIADIDTRRLTRILRDKGAQNGCIICSDELDESSALAQAKAFPGLKGMDLAKVVSITEPKTWTEGSWELGKGHVTPS